MGKTVSLARTPSYPMDTEATVPQSQGQKNHCHIPNDQEGYRSTVWESCRKGRCCLQLRGSRPIPPEESRSISGGKTIGPRYPFQHHCPPSCGKPLPSQGIGTLDGCHASAPAEVSDPTLTLAGCRPGAGGPLPEKGPTTGCFR